MHDPYIFCSFKDLIRAHSTASLWLQEIMAREQELLLEEFTHFVGLLNNRTDLTVQHGKAWTMDELMENIHPVCFCAPPLMSHKALTYEECHFALDYMQL